jgi:hypothetical protein
MHRGYIKLHRKILDWEWFDESLTFWFFIHLLFLANWETKQWHGIEIKRGQFVSSIEHLRFRHGIGKRSKLLTTMQVRTLIQRLKSTNEITSHSTTTFTIFTIVNYEKYQSNETNETTNGETNEQQTSNKPTTTTKEYKELKNIYICSPTGSPPTNRFEKPTQNELELTFASLNVANPKNMALEFFDFYESKGWVVGKSPMKSWKHACNRWARQNRSNHVSERKPFSVSL